MAKQLRRDCHDTLRASRPCCTASPPQAGSILFLVRLMEKLYMRPVLFIAVLVLAVAPMGAGQEQSARRSHRTSVEETIRKLDNERIQAQIHADATALDRIYAADFIGVGPSGRVRTKPQVILDFTSGDFEISIYHYR